MIRKSRTKFEIKQNLNRRLPRPQNQTLKMLLKVYFMVHDEKKRPIEIPSPPSHFAVPRTPPKEKAAPDSVPSNWDETPSRHVECASLPKRFKTTNDPEDMSDD